MYIKQLMDAAGQPTGWQWYDRQGNTIDYDTAGRIQGYANASGVRVSFAYDSAGSARILDHHGATIYTVSMAGGLITRVEDLTGRSVSYQWTGQRLTQVTDVLGNVWKYEYDGNGQITSRTDPLGAKASVQYSQSIQAPQAMLSLGRAGIVIDPTGSSGTTQKLANLWGGGRVGRLDSQGCTQTGATQYLREARTFEVTHIDCRGNTTVTQYDLQGNPLNKTRNGQRTSSTEWDGAWQQKTTDARGYSTTTRYDTNYQPLQITYPDGSVEKYTYEPIHGYKSSHTDPLGITSTWAYDGRGNVTEWTQAKGLPEQRTTRYQYDQYSQLVSTTRGAGDGRGQDAVTQSYQYDSAGNVTAQTDGEGRTRTTAYDKRGAPTSQTNALGRTTILNFDVAGRLVKTTNALGHSVEHQYDARGRRTQTTSAAGKVQRAHYDQYGRVIETIVPGQSEGAGTRIAYDDAGQPIKTTSPGGLVTQTIYDSQGRISTTTDPAGNTTRYEYGQDGTPQAGLLIAVQYPTYRETYQYDQRGRQTTTTQHLENNQTRTQSQTYDALGQRAASSDPAGRTTLYGYDALGRLTQTTDPAGNHTKQTWNALDQLTSLTDANGNTHRFEYDKAGNQTKETRPMGEAIQYGYDAEGNLTQRTDAGGNTKTYSYDQGGRLTLEEHKLGGTTLDQRISYQYDADGQMSAYEQKDGSGNLISSASYTKDAWGRTTQSAVTYGKVEGGTFSFTLGQDFNVDGQLASHTYPDGSTQTYSYSQGQLAKVTLPNHSEITYGNYQWMQPSTIQTPGSTKTQHFDALQRYTGIEVKNASNQILASRQYQYDSAGNITQIDGDLGKTTYGYDSLDQLTEAQPDQNLRNLGLPHEQYSYDAVGNRTASAHQPGTWSYNGDNQLVQYPKTTPFSASPPIETQVSYTAQGHTARETNGQGERTYSYNAAERLVEVSQGGQTATYRYDSLGRRISKTVGAASNTTYYLYNDAGLVAEANAQGQMTRAYGWSPKAGQQGLWSTDPIWQAQTDSSDLAVAATEYHYLHTDHLYTPTLATSRQGSVSWRGVSEAFGATASTVNAIDMNLRFPGQYWDREFNTHHNLNRDYKPQIGRYIQSDPIGVDGGIGFYLYVNANPMGLIDSLGDQAQCLPNPQPCYQFVVTMQQLIGAACTAAIVAVSTWMLSNSNNSSGELSEEKMKERRHYKYICERLPNPFDSGNDKCKAAEWERDRINQCIRLRMDWDKKWGIAHNAQVYKDLENRLKKIQKILNSRECCEECRGN